MRTMVLVLLSVLLATALSAQPRPSFDQRTFKEADFSRCDFTGAGFEACLFGRALLRNCTGDDVRIEGGEFARLSLRESKLPALMWYNVELREGKFERGTLKGSALSYVSLEDMRFDRCDARRQVWAYCDLREVVFDRAEMRDARFDSVNVANARFDDTDFSQGRLSRCEFDGARFERGSLRGASFWGTDFSNVRLDNCEIRGLTINGVDIEELLRQARR